MLTISVQKIEETDKTFRAKCTGGKGEVIQYLDFEDEEDYGDEDEDE